MEQDKIETQFKSGDLSQAPKRLKQQKPLSTKSID